MEQKENDKEPTEDEIKEAKEEEEYDPDKSGAGPIKDRSCTDVLCLGLLIAFLVVWVMIAAWGVAHGDPSKLMYPTDSYGNICGKGDFAEKPYLMFFDLTKCASLTAIAGCPTPQVRTWTDGGFHVFSCRRFAWPRVQRTTTAPGSRPRSPSPGWRRTCWVRRSRPRCQRSAPPTPVRTSWPGTACRS